MSMRSYSGGWHDIVLFEVYPTSWIQLGEAARRIGAKLYIPSEL